MDTEYNSFEIHSNAFQQPKEELNEPLPLDYQEQIPSMSIPYMYHLLHQPENKFSVVRSDPKMFSNNDTGKKRFYNEDRQDKPLCANAKRQRLVDPKEECDSSSLHIRPFQEIKWRKQFQELLAFKKEMGHCLVPHSYSKNPTLSRWVKRQRYQYKLRKNGERSTLTAEREKALEDIGFIWDSHASVWDENWNKLIEYKERNGHCNVPYYYPSDQKLATWVKAQRRQYALFMKSKPSTITLGRIVSLDYLDFDWKGY